MNLEHFLEVQELGRDHLASLANVFAWALTILAADARTRHLKHLLKEYCFNYFNIARPHQGIRQRLPTEPAFSASADPAIVVGVPVLGGLHHDYRAAA